MTVATRATALLLQAALLVLPLSAARADCGRDHTVAAVMAEMTGTMMPGMTMPGDPDPAHDECPTDAASHCTNMLVCGAAVMIAEPLLVAALQPAVIVDAMRFPSDPLSVTYAPEPPPPRA